MKKKIKKVTLSDPLEIIKMINAFELKRGFVPSFIVTTPEKRKVIMEWFGHAPEAIDDALGYSIHNIPFVTPRELMIL